MVDNQVYGSSGTVYFSGIQADEEYNIDLIGEKATKTYDRMVRSDGQIRSIVSVLELPLARADWSVKPGGDKATDKEIAQFVSDNLFGGMARPWSEILSHQLSSFKYGFAVSEKIWAKPKDGKIRYRNISPRLAKTVYRWFPGADDEIHHIEQRVWKNNPDGKPEYKIVQIPGEKLVVVTMNKEGANFQGISLLRSAYKHWFYKDQLYRVDAIANERNGLGVPVVIEPENVKPTDRETTAKALSAFHAHEKAYLIFPPGYSFSLQGVTGQVRDVRPSIEHHDLLIARSVLASFLNLDQGGSYALSRDGSSFFLQATQGYATLICDVFNKDVIRPLVDLNFRNVERYPTLTCARLETRDVGELLLSNLPPMITAKIITPNHDTENVVRKILGLPELPKDTPQAGVAVVTPPPDDPNQAKLDKKLEKESSNPIKDSQGKNAEDEDEKDKGEEILSAPPIVTDSCIICLVPKTETDLRLPGGEIDPHVTLAYIENLNDESFKRTARVVRTFASHSPISGKIGGVGRFAGDSVDAFHVTVDSAEVLDLRNKVIAMLKLHDVHPSMDHGFIPHITLKYLEFDEPNPLTRIPASTVSFNTIEIWVGDKHIAFPFHEASDLAWREPTPLERYCDIEGMNKSLDEFRAKLYEAVTPIINRQTEILLTVGEKYVKAGKAVDLDKIQVPHRREMTDAILEVMKEAHAFGTSTVTSELRRQGATLGLIDFIGDRLIREMYARASSLAGILAVKLKGVFGVEINRQSGDGGYNRSTLQDTMRNAGLRDVKANAGTVIQDTFTAGRDAAATQAGVQYAEYSAVMDVNTCLPCRSLDGRSVRLDSEEYRNLMPPNPNCHGRDNCRCIFVYRLWEQTNEGEN